VIRVAKGARVWFSMMLLILGLLQATTLGVQAERAITTDQSPDEFKVRQFPAVRTGKERLGGKASDEQRVDDCKVPLELRGPTPRPDVCGDGPSTRSQR
jgi:hypothetical protein